MILLGIVLLSFARLVQASSGDNPHVEETVFHSVVSISAIGNNAVALNEANAIENLFQTSYRKLTDEKCSFRSIQNIKLIDIKEKEDDVTVGLPNSDEANISLHFELSVKCFNCASNAELFTDGTDESMVPQNNEACYWNEEMLSDNSVPNLAPAADEFIQTFNEIVTVEGSSDITLTGVVVDLTTIEDEDQLYCPCPPNSFCTYTNEDMNDFWKISPGLFHNCTCKEGFYGKDGWRCERVDECEEKNWKCAPEEEGGYCVMTDPGNIENPFFKCGCRVGFKANDNYTQDDLHGVKHCVKDEAYESKLDEDLNDEDLSFTLAKECYDNEKTFAIIASLKVKGNPATIFADQETIEESVKTAYENSLTSKCPFRLLESVTLMAYTTEDGELKFISNAEENDAIDTISTDITNNSNDLKNDDDNSAGSKQDSHNFTIIFSMNLRCFQCAYNAVLFNDTSLVQQRFLRQDGSLREGDGSTEDATIVNIAPSRDAFMQEFNKDIIVQDVETVEEGIEVKDKQIDDVNDINTENLIDIIDEQIVSVDCRTECNTDNQYCGFDGLCWCKPGYIAPSGRGGACQDLKECATGVHKCSRNAVCIELEGSYACKCNDGFVGDGFSCMVPTISQSPTQVPSTTFLPTNNPTVSFSPTKSPPLTRSPTPVPTPALPNPTVAPVAPVTTPIFQPVPTNAAPEFTPTGIAPTNAPTPAPVQDTPIFATPEATTPTS